MRPKIAKNRLFAFLTRSLHPLQRKTEAILQNKPSPKSQIRAAETRFATAFLSFASDELAILAIQSELVSQSANTNPQQLGRLGSVTNRRFQSSENVPFLDLV